MQSNGEVGIQKEHAQERSRDVVVGGSSREPARDPALPPSDCPPSPRRNEYEPHDPLAARGVGTSPPRALRPYKPSYIEAIRHGVQDMVPAGRRL
nr:hypothetical protein Itr_chr02CG09180 [Ipomoea trifida]